MLKILSWFIGIIFSLILIYFIFKFGGQFLRGEIGFFQNNNTQIFQNPNNLFQDNNSNNNTPSFLEKWFPGVFPLFRSSDNQNNPNLQNDANYENTVIHQNGETYRYNDNNDDTYIYKEESRSFNQDLQEYIDEVGFGK